MSETETDSPRRARLLFSRYESIDAVQEGYAQTIGLRCDIVMDEPFLKIDTEEMSRYMRWRTGDVRLRLEQLILENGHGFISIRHEWRFVAKERDALRSDVAWSHVQRNLDRSSDETIESLVEKEIRRFEAARAVVRQEEIETIAGKVSNLVLRRARELAKVDSRWPELLADLAIRRSQAMEDIFEEFEKSKEIRPDDFHAVRKLVHEYVQKQSDQDTLRAGLRIHGPSIVFCRVNRYDPFCHDQRFCAFGSAGGEFCSRDLRCLWACGKHKKTRRKDGILRTNEEADRERQPDFPRNQGSRAFLFSSRTRQASRYRDKERSLFTSRRASREGVSRVHDKNRVVQ